MTLIIILYFKEYQSQKQSDKNDEYEENRYSSTDFDYRQIQS